MINWGFWGEWPGARGCLGRGWGVDWVLLVWCPAFSAGVCG